MLNEKTIEDLKAKHPDSRLRALSANGTDIVVKSPSRAEWDRFKLQVADERKKVRAAENLFRSCCVYPEPATLDAMIAEYPALADRFAAEVIEMGGMVEEIEKKDL